MRSVDAQITCIQNFQGQNILTNFALNFLVNELIEMFFKFGISDENEKNLGTGHLENAQKVYGLVFVSTFFKSKALFH